MLYKDLQKHSATPVCHHSIATEWDQNRDQIQQFYFAIIPLTVDHAIAGRRELTCSNVGIQRKYL